MALFNYECDEVKRKIDEVSPNYPQLTTFEKEWLFFHKYHYIPGIPVELECETVSVYPIGSVFNAIPFQYKSAILKGNTDENLQSVKMPVLKMGGKNLFDLKEALDRTNTNYIVIDDSYDFKVSLKLFNTKIFEPTTTGQLTLSYEALCKDITNFRMGFVYKDGTYEQAPYVSSTTQYEKRTITSNIDKEVDYIKMDFKDPGNVLLRYVQIEESSVATSYEPYKTYIFTVNEEVELRGIGDVQDTLNCLNGELTERIGKWIFNGTQSINKIEDLGDYVNIRFTVDGVKQGTGFLANHIYCDVLPVVNDLEIEYNQECIKLYGQPDYMEIRLTLSKTKISANANSVNTYLQSNPITVYYQLANESIKTVALTPLKKPYEGTNYYELTSNIPCEAILEVPVVSTGKQTLEEINN